MLFEISRRDAQFLAKLRFVFARSAQREMNLRKKFSRREFPAAEYVYPFGYFGMGLFVAQLFPSLTSTSTVWVGSGWIRI